MALIPLDIPIKQPPYIFTNYEKLAMEIIPEEQLKSTNHNEKLIDMMIAEEMRDANPEKTKQDIYKGLESGNLTRVLTASKNLSPTEKNRITKGLYHHLLNKAELTKQERIKLLILTKYSHTISLIDLCIKISQS